MDAPVAVVTGASSGIGAAFARELARRGHDLVLVARTESRLAELAAQLDTEHGTQVEVLGADLESDAGIERVAERLTDSGRPVELLVNNAGFATSGRFHELPVDQERAEIHLNVSAVLELTHAALGPMVERGHGGVINVSSIGAYAPTPMSATYCATKAFISSFTNAVHEELRGTGVKAMVLAPGFTRTEFHIRAGIENTDQTPGFLWQSADEVAEAAMKSYDKGRAVCLPGALNTTAAAFSASVPAALSRRIAGMVAKRTY